MRIEAINRTPAHHIEKPVIDENGWHIKREIDKSVMYLYGILGFISLSGLMLLMFSRGSADYLTASLMILFPIIAIWYTHNKCLKYLNEPFYSFKEGTLYFNNKAVAKDKEIIQVGINLDRQTFGNGKWKYVRELVFVLNNEKQLSILLSNDKKEFEHFYRYIMKDGSKKQINKACYQEASQEAEKIVHKDHIMKIMIITAVILYFLTS